MQRTFRKIGQTFILSVLILSLLSTTVFAADQDDPNYSYALKLKELGVFVGTDNGFELNRVPTRIEGLVMLVRLLGKEKEAQALKGNASVFNDVPDWARGYVNYAKNNGLTNGISPTLFGSLDPMSAPQYVTFLLRSLGYSDAKGDFVWSESLTKAKSIGMITSTSTYTSTTFIRSHIAKLSYDALKTIYKNSNTSLAQYLVNLGAIDESTAIAIQIIDHPAFVNGKLYALKDNMFYDLGENDCYVDVVASASISNSKKEDVYVHSGEAGKASHSLLILPRDGYSTLVLRYIHEKGNVANQLHLLSGRVTSLAAAKATTPYKSFSITESSTFVSIDLSKIQGSELTLYLDIQDKGNVFLYNLYLE